MRLLLTSDTHGKLGIIDELATMSGQTQSFTPVTLVSTILATIGGFLYPHGQGDDGATVEDRWRHG